MARRMVLFVALVCSMALPGCVGSTVTKVGEINYQPTPNDTVSVYLPDDAPEVLKHAGAFLPSSELPPGAITVGWINSIGGSAASWDAFIKDAQHQAHELGGDAVVVDRFFDGGLFVQKTMTSKAVRLNP